MTRNVHWFAGLLCFTVFSLRADQIVMQNGDLYNGKVISLTTNVLVLQSDVLGKITLPAASVATIHLGVAAATNAAPPVAATVSLPRVSAVTQTGPDTDLSTALRQLGSQTNLIQQLQSQFLAGAGPQADDKFNELISGLASGKISMDDLRAQAQSAAEQLRSVEKDLGPDASEAVDGYLGVLNEFLSETGDTNSTATPSVTLSVTPPKGGSIGEK